ncbi:RNA polymerase sigma factor [Echinicola sp. 20G]|uniref:RNA polymerase sigma factor n=1 Tax=Echinicola sp. 20G TaxID=2781961 RepID=UPI0019102924|nr:sigma-70 family RNA polymerase sigma factor [Echinicola sp. 20G]
MLDHFSDSQLIEEIREGSKTAFDQLYHKYWGALYKAAFARLKSQDISEDIVQEIFIDLWNRKENLHITSSLKVYLLTAVKYKVFRQLDLMYRHESLEKVENYINSSSNLLEFEEVYHLIEISLDKLAETHRLIFKMNKIEGISVKEVSEKVNMAPQSVHNILSQTSKFLKKELKGYYSIFL